MKPWKTKSWIMADLFCRRAMAVPRAAHDTSVSPVESAALKKWIAAVLAPKSCV